LAPFGQAVSEEKMFLTSANQKKKLIRAILVSDWLLFKKSSSLKLLGKMEPNLAGNIYVRSSMKHLHLVPFGQHT
jgi:hypothetical protein